jgi:hypothetical protein
MERAKEIDSKCRAEVGADAGEFTRTSADYDIRNWKSKAVTSVSQCPILPYQV